MAISSTGYFSHQYFGVLAEQQALRNATPPTQLPIISQLLHLIQLVAQNDVVALELNAACKFPLLQQQREPQLVIGPHLVKRDFVTVEPLGSHFYSMGKVQVCNRFPIKSFKKQWKLYLPFPLALHCTSRP